MAVLREMIATPVPKFLKLVLSRAKRSAKQSGSQFYKANFKVLDVKFFKKKMTFSVEACKKD